MPGQDEFDDGDRPRRRHWDDDDRPIRREGAESRPRPSRPQKSNTGLVVVLLVVVFLVICGGVGGVAFWAIRTAKQEMAQVQAAMIAEVPKSGYERMPRSCASSTPA